MRHLLVRRVLVIALLVGVVLLTGTVGFTLIEGYTPFDAFYMTLFTMTTVGYSELHELSRAGRIFNSFIIVFGVTTIFVAIGAMTQTVIELELGEFFEKRRAQRMIQKLSSHFIICGFGRVGRSAAADFQAAGVPFVVVDLDPDRVERAIRMGMLAVLADSTRDETLLELGIKQARGLVAALASDADNLFVVLSAKTLNPMLNVAARAAEEEAEQKLRRAGADVVFAPYTSAGHRLAQALLRPHVVHFLDVATHSVGLDVAIEQMRVADDSEFSGRSLSDLQIRRDLGAIVLAIRKADGAMLFNPPADSVISGGDFLIVMGEIQNLRKLESMLAGVRA